MTANAGYHAYATGDVLTAAQVQYNLQNQTVMYFATTTARDAALTGAILVEGMVSYIPATGLMYYNGSAWTAVGASNVPTLSNPVLNSAFQVWQRGTSIAVAASSIPYTADRWQIATGVNEAFTVSRQATGDTTNLPNIQYCARVQRNSGQTGTTAISFVQSFESINSIPFAGKSVVFSFYARAGANFSGVSATVRGVLATGTGTDQNRLTAVYTGETQPIIQDAILTTTWQRFTGTGTVPATATEMGIVFTSTPTGTAGTNDYFEITGVQLELGSIATPFDTYATTIQGELAACQRYYWRNSAAYGSIGIIQQQTTTLAGTVVPFPVQMRTVPTLDANSGTNYFVVKTLNTTNTISSAWTLDVASLTSSEIYITTPTTVAGSAGFAYLNNTSAYIGFSAEL